MELEDRPHQMKWICAVEVRHGLIQFEVFENNSNFSAVIRTIGDSAICAYLTWNITGSSPLIIQGSWGTYLRKIPSMQVCNFITSRKEGCKNSQRHPSWCCLFIPTVPGFQFLNEDKTRQDTEDSMGVCDQNLPKSICFQFQTYNICGAMVYNPSLVCCLSNVYGLFQRAPQSNTCESP